MPKVPEGVMSVTSHTADCGFVTHGYACSCGTTKDPCPSPLCCRRGRFSVEHDVLPEPPELTPELLAQIRKESREARAAMKKTLDKMEPTAADMRVVVGGPGCLCRKR